MASPSSDCWAPDAEGELRTLHAHFEGRCIVEPLEPDFAERWEAFLAGGWDEWHRVGRAQRQRVHGIFTHPPTGETDTICQHDAPGRWTDSADEITCERCLKVIAEILEANRSSGARRRGSRHRKPSLVDPAV